MRKNALFSWSSGKDSAYALYNIVKEKKYHVVGLLTTITEDYQRVSIHGTPIKLLEEQAQSLNLPLHYVKIPAQCTNDIYAQKTLALLHQLDEVDYLMFGDIHLADVKAYREKLLAKTHIKPLFPLWGMDAHRLSLDIINSGIAAVTTCVDLKKLDKGFVGKPYDREFLKALPKQIDPCGENGEFHTFVYQSPLFHQSIAIEIGAIVQKGEFLFADVVQ